MQIGNQLREPMLPVQGFENVSPLPYDVNMSSHEIKVAIETQSKHHQFESPSPNLQNVQGPHNGYKEATHTHNGHT